MKKLVSVLTLAMSGLLATSAMAGPYEQDRRQHYSKPTPPPAHWNQGQQNRYDHKRAQSNVNPSRHWRVGQQLPRQFESSRYEIDGREVRKLPKAGRNQQWYKINGDYVLVNERNDRIIRIIG